MPSNTSLSSRFKFQTWWTEFWTEIKVREKYIYITSWIHPLVADVEKSYIIWFSNSKDEIIKYASSRQRQKVKTELMDLIKSLAERKYRDSAEVTIDIGEIKGGRKSIRSAWEIESSEPPNKKEEGWH